jgi:hypothetical protein
MWLCGHIRDNQNDKNDLIKKSKKKENKSKIQN